MRSKPSKNFVYSKNAQTSISFEIPSARNPYINEHCYIYGYDALEISKNKSLSDAILLMFTGDFPEPEKSALFERLATGMINLGPRHAAVRAAMTAGVSKTGVEHLLPIGLTILGGEKNGAAEVYESMNFILKNLSTSPSKVASDLLATEPHDSEGEVHVAPGFGNQYGGIDIFTQRLASTIFEDYSPPSPIIRWVCEFCEAINARGFGWLRPGLAATIFCELDIGAREAISLYQLICAPGIAAHGLEQTHKPITAMPMISDEDYIYIQPKTRG